MKKNSRLLTIIFVIFVICITAVTKNANCQILKDEAVWTVKLTFTGDEPVERYEKVSVLKDTVINDTVYKLFHYRNSISVLREKNKKVYYKILKHSHPYGPIDSTEQVLYDFNLNLGDSIFLNLIGNSDYYSTYWHVIKVDTIKVNEELKKRMLLHMYPSELDGFQYWIEDIGSTYGPLYFQQISEHEFMTRLDCYQINGETIYGDCVTVGSKIMKEDKDLNIMYDHVSQQIKIRSSKQGICTLNIYTISGSKIYNKVTNYNQSINVQGLNSGIYIFEILINSNRLRKKLIINTY